MGRILLTGGTGFVGSNIRKALRDRELRLLVRDPSSARVDDSTDIVQGDVLQPDTLGRAVDGCDTVIHLVAIIEESGSNTFDKVIRQGTENMVAAAKDAGVTRFIQMSALGAQANPRFPYLNAKWGAEEAVRSSGMDWTIFRPSVIFGPGDGFINVLASLIRKAPVIPVVGAGESKFQPVAVGEVAEAYRRAVDDQATVGQVYELGGGEIYTYQGLIDLIAEHLGKHKFMIHMPVPLMKAVVAMSAPLPKALRPPVTKEQLNMLALDNCTDHSRTAELIGRPPIALRNGLDYIGKS